MVKPNRDCHDNSPPEKTVLEDIAEQARVGKSVSHVGLLQHTLDYIEKAAKKVLKQ